MPISNSPRFASTTPSAASARDCRSILPAASASSFGTPAELERGPVATRELEEVRRSEPVARGLGGLTAGGEGVGGAGERLDRSRPVADQGEDAPEPALGGGEGGAVPVGLVEARRLAPGAGGVGRLARELGPLPVVLERLQPRPATSSPSGQSSSARRAIVAASRYARTCLELSRGANELLAGPSLVMGAEPVRRDLDAGRRQRLEALGELAVERAAAQPRHVAVEGLADERVPELGRTVLLLDDEPELDQLRDPVLAGQLDHRLEPEPLAADGGDLGRRPAGLREVGAAQQDGVADRLRHRHLTALDELEPRRAVPKRGLRGERPRQLLDEERQPLRAALDRLDERPRRRPVERLLEQRRGRGLVERIERDLDQRLRSPQLVAHPPQRVIARELVGAVGADDEHRHLAECRRDRGEQLERRRVRPLQVVEHEQRSARFGDAVERAAERLVQGRRIDVVGGRAELREQHSQLLCRAGRSDQGRRARREGASGARRRPGRRPASRRGWPLRAEPAPRRTP